MNSAEIRQTFLDFFEKRQHRVMPSSSLIPLGDPTLLLTSAGMVQFKPYFTGEAVPPSPRLASCQKCFRVTDIDAVGDATHLTFFEMLGNFSVGDYFKREAIGWAWEFVIDVLKLPEERLWVTIYLDDDEAFRCWREVGVSEQRIWRFGEEDNFWGPAGDTGPCGPCSEIHYDLGEDRGCGRPECGPNCECGRFSEIWNLVFTQYDQQEDGTRLPLPNPNIDTGMGLERIAAAMQGKLTVYDTDLFLPLMEKAERLTGTTYGKDGATNRALRVVAEHGRAISFLLADGVMPSNEGRGYVLRRVLRRAVLFGKKLGLSEPFLTDLAEVTIAHMQHEYPELRRERDFVLATVEAEESRFDQTLEVGLNVLESVVDEAKREGRDTISGEEIFKLYDTYGFPKETTAEVAAESGLALDLDGFEAQMERQRERARAAQNVAVSGKPVFGDSVSAEHVPRSTDFIGDRTLRGESTVLVLLPKAEWSETPLDSVSEGEYVGVILRETPFYGEMGGQVGDTGAIRGSEGRVEVTNTVRHIVGGSELVVHQGRVVEGTISVNDRVTASVDRERRLDIARNHTATHLLQTALRRVVGGHVRQSGSLVAPERLRFDFGHPAALSEEELQQVQETVNDLIRQDLEVKGVVMSYGEAVDAGALAFFGEKYGEEVRVLQIGEPPVSLELCGGTHVKRTGEIGYFHIVAESSIGTGMRRIEAVTGRGAERFIAERLSIVERLAAEMKTPVSNVENRVAALQGELEGERKKAVALERRLLAGSVDSVLGEAESVNGVTVVAARVGSADMDALRQTGDMVRGRLQSALVVLGAEYGGRANFVAMVTPDLVKRGLHAGRIVKQVAEVAGGGGGGKAEVGQGGGKDVSKLDAALGLARELVAAHGDTGT
ncbi:MAG: alanine--tRNA ligase [Chloroflexota bacterium]